MSACVECKADVTEFVCLCEWLPRQHLCGKCMSESVSHRPSEKSPHYKIPFSLSLTLTDQSDYERVVQRMGKFEETKGVLKEKEEEAQSMENECNEVIERVKPRISKFHDEKMAKLQAYRQQLSTASTSEEEIQKMIFDPNYKSTNPTVLACWEYINGTTETLRLNPDLPSNLTEEYQELLTSLDPSKPSPITQEIERSQKIFDECEEEKLREQKTLSEIQGKVSDLNHRNEELKAEAKTAENNLFELRVQIDELKFEISKVQNAIPKVKERQYPSLFSVFDRRLMWRKAYECGLAACCFVYVGYKQMQFAKNLKMTPAVQLDMLLSAALCGSFGAAVNRLRIVGANGMARKYSIRKWDCMYSLGFCNYCLLQQEELLSQPEYETNPS